MTTESIDVAAAAAHPPQPRVRTGRLRMVGWLLSVVVLLALVLLSIAIGSQSMPLSEVIHALLHPGHTNDDLIITGLRIPRTVLGLFVGAALGVAGALIQAFTRNPLADPGILGVNAGASLAVVIGIAFLGMTTIGQYLWMAFAGAIVTTVAVYAIGASGRTGATAVRMTLTGVGIGAILSGITSVIALSKPNVFEGSLNWSAGALAGTPLSTAWTVAPFIVCGLLIAAAITRDLNALALGDEMAASLGSRASITRVLAVISVTLLAGAATAAAGPIGFIGLMIPRAARWITGPDQRWIFAYALTLGPCLLLASDIVGRIVMEPAELPVGIVTPFIGAPVLILLARRVRTSNL